MSGTPTIPEPPITPSRSGNGTTDGDGGRGNNGGGNNGGGNNGGGGDDDKGGNKLVTITPINVTESAAQGGLTLGGWIVSLDSPSDKPITMSYRISSGGDAQSDLLLSPDQVNGGVKFTFSPGTTKIPIQLPVKDDKINEHKERVVGEFGITSEGATFPGVTFPNRATFAQSGFIITDDDVSLPGHQVPQGIEVVKSAQGAFFDELAKDPGNVPAVKNAIQKYAKAWEAIGVVFDAGLAISRYEAQAGTNPNAARDLYVDTMDLSAKFAFSKLAGLAGAALGTLLGPGILTATAGVVAAVGASVAYDSSMQDWVRVWASNLYDNEVKRYSKAQVTGDANQNEVMSSPAPDVLRGGGGDDKFSGSLLELNGDRIQDFNTNEHIVVKGAAFGVNNVKLTKGSTIISIDTDLNGVPEATFTLDLDLDLLRANNYELKVVPTAGGTAIGFERVLPVRQEPSGNPNTKGNDTITGGPGLDMAFYDGVRKSYNVTDVTSAGARVSGPEGTDTLAGVEHIQFYDGFLTTNLSGSAAQIYRIYGATLGRAPDSAGLANWNDAVEKGVPLKTIVEGFTGSAEFQSRYGATSNQQFVQLVYKNVLGRDGDTPGTQFWVNSLNNGAGRPDIVLGFSESQEYVNRTAPNISKGLWVGDVEAATVARVYYATLDRKPDVGGLAVWTALLNTGMTDNQLSDSFTNSAEFRTKYGALNNDQFVELLYNNVLDRPSDPAGKGVWVNALNSGAQRSDVVLGFSDSLEHMTKLSSVIDDGIVIG